MSTPKELNIQQLAFCREYVLCGNAGTAYAKAYGREPDKGGRTVNSANASRLLKDDRVSAEVARLKADVAGTVGITAAMIAQELARLGFSDLTRVVKFDEHGLKPLKGSDELPEGDRRAIRSITETTTTTTSPDGWVNESRKFKVELHEKKAALDSLNKMLGYNAPDKLDATLKVDPVDTTDQIIKRFEALDASAATGSDSEP